MSAQSISCKLALDFPADARYLDGHFDNGAIVPAVAILSATTRQLHKQQGTTIAKWKTVKFLQPLIPPLEVVAVVSEMKAGQLQIRWVPAADSDESNVLAEAVVMVTSSRAEEK